MYNETLYCYKCHENYTKAKIKIKGIQEMEEGEVGDIKMDMKSGS